MIGILSVDCFYRQIAKLSRLDAVTRVYVDSVIRHYFHRVKAATEPLLYILDNSLRTDRYEAAIELLSLAGITTVSPRSHGSNWNTLAAVIRSGISQGTHAAYIEPDATVNHIDAALELAKTLNCIATFRNLAPDDPKFEVTNVQRSLN